MCVCAVSYLIFSVKLISRDYDHVNLEKLAPLFFSIILLFYYIFLAPVLLKKMSSYFVSFTVM